MREAGGASSPGPKDRSGRELAAAVGLVVALATLTPALLTGARSWWLVGGLALVAALFVVYARGGRGAIGLALLAAVGLGGCRAAPQENLSLEPAVVRFSPRHTVERLALVNHGDAPIPLAELRVDPRGRDWGSFTIEDRVNPREIPPGAQVEVTIRAHVRHFADPATPHHFHDARARLLFRADGVERGVDLVFAELDGRGGRAGVWWIALGLAALSLTALVLPGATRRPRGIEPALAATLLLAVVFAFAPIADALCPSQLAAVLSLADLEQCRDGRAGAPAALVPADAGLALVLACLAALALRSLARVDRAPIRAASDRALGLGLLVLIVAVLGPAYALGRGDLHGLALAQAAAADWGVVVAPLSAVAAIVAASYVAPETGGAGRLATATVIALAFLGGFSTPAQLLTAAGVGSVAAATIGLAALGFGLAALAWVHARASTGRRRAWCSAIAAAATLGLAASLLAAGSGADQLPLPHLAVVGGQLLVTAAKVIAVGALVALVSAALERRASSRRDAPGRGSADDAAARGSSTDDRPQAASAPWLLQAAMVLALLSLAVSALRPLPG